jgi:hypothetical protein
MGGQCQAAACMTHVLVTLGALELVKDHALELAFTQGDLAHALGISNVHVNRAIQDFRNHNCFLPARENWEDAGLRWLKTEGELDPSYLHLLNKAAL